MRLTRFRGVDGTLYVIPNGDIRLIGNLSRGWARAIVDLTLPGCQRGGPRDGPARDLGGGARGAQRTRAFAAHCTEPPDPRRVAHRGLDVDHHAGDAADRSPPSATR